MSKKNMRSTSATRKRIENIKALIWNLRFIGQMGRDEFAEYLSQSPSGGRKYLQELVKDEVVYISSREPVAPGQKEGVPIYRLNVDEAFIDAYLLKLDALPTNLTERRTLVDYTGKSRLQKVQAEDGRQVHMLVDDVEHKPRTARFKIPEHEPVLAHFFGMVAA